jgi:hypothetical protein
MAPKSPGTRNKEFCHSFSRHAILATRDPTQVLTDHKKSQLCNNRAMRNPSRMVNSFVWSAEEAKYLKAIFRWQETAPSSDEERRRRQAEEDERRRQEEQKPVGEFRVLVIGGRGTGKTAILTRVRTPPHPS